MSQELDPVAGGRQDGGCGEWVVVIEATTLGGLEGDDFEQIQDLLGRLREWRSSGLYNPRRYAIQLRITAEAPHEALRRAIGYHDLAARAVGLSDVSVTRAEVLTVAEYESAGLLAPTPPASLPAAGGPVPRARNPLISDDLYAATRALLRVSSVTQITEVLVRFVFAVGGSVNLGECRSMGGMIAVDISVDGRSLSAVAEAMSMGGMILEQTLPSLVADARLAALRLGESNS